MFNTTLIGKKIATLRKENNLTQMDLADIMGGELSSSKQLGAW